MFKMGAYFATVSLAVFVFLPGARADSPFEFHSGFWVNLHQFLYEQAGSQTPLADDSPAWQGALEYYRREVVKRNLLSDEAATINNRLSGLDDAAALRDSGLPPGLIAALEAAAPIYKARRWPDHDRANRAWIAAVTPLVSKYSESLEKELATAYQTGWPAAPIRTDVAEYASFAGAYTTLDPAHITVSSINPVIRATLRSKYCFTKHPTPSSVKFELLWGRRRLDSIGCSAAGISGMPCSFTPRAR